MTSKTYLFSRSMWGVYESFQDLDTLDIKTTSYNLFAYLDTSGVDILKNLKSFNLALGGRYNHHSSYGDRFTYEINPSYKINKNTLVYLSHSTGFSAPPLYRLFTPNENFVSGIKRGNKNLNPEISSIYETGLKYNLLENIKMTVSYFSTKIKNNIDYVYLWDNSIAIDELGTDWMRNDYRGDTYLNIGTMYSSGYEFSLSADFFDQLLITGSVSLIDGKLKYKPSEIDNEQTQGNHVQLFSNGAFLNKEVEDIGLLRRANTANLSITYLPINELMVRISLKYVGEKDDIYYNTSIGPWGALDKIAVSDYTLLDFTAKYSFTSQISASLRVENLLDEKYVEIFGYNTRGRSIYLGLRYSL